ncbi:hypothetical protein CRG98_001822 [Punica granatum]|uniref:ABC transporter domain-containing protein n=1 Tax=Punica granatum TaxID=22663 RepID=A0A2I0LAQ5_PUNGR|nr:hypothetical protein CRG98_001822 [Punica granatum]
MGLESDKTRETQMNERKNKKKTWSLRSVFMHANRVDKFLMALGLVGAVCNGFSMPVVLFVTDHLINAIGTSPSLDSEVFRDSMNKGRTLMRIARKIRKEYNMASTIAEQAVSSIQTVYAFVGVTKTMSKFPERHDIRNFLDKALGSALLNLKYFSEACAAGERILERVPTIDPDQEEGEILHSFTSKVEFNLVDFSYPSRPREYHLQGLFPYYSCGKGSDFVIQRGQVVKAGPHEELIQNPDGRYTALLSLQEMENEEILDKTKPVATTYSSSSILSMNRVNSTSSRRLSKASRSSSNRSTRAGQSSLKPEDRFKEKKLPAPSFRRLIALNLPGVEASDFRVFQRRAVLGSSQWFDEDENSSGAICSRLAKDAAVVKSLVGDRMALLLQTCSGVAIAFMTGLIIAWRLAIVIIAAQPLIILCFYAHEADKDQARDMEGYQPRTISGDIEFYEVDFAYPARPDVVILKNFSFNIEAGKLTALVGQGGSGKSTLIGLSERFYDSLKPTLFAGTIRENIEHGISGHITETEILVAAKAANAHEFIVGLQDGYDTWGGYQGIQLSGGQKQQVAIGRAILKEPRLLLLDEATSALDSQSERVVQDALEELMKGRTSMVTAHGLSTIYNCDLTAVLNNGKVVEEGSHSSLLAKGPTGACYSLVNLQNTYNSGTNLNNF